MPHPSQPTDMSLPLRSAHSHTHTHTHTHIDTARLLPGSMCHMHRNVRCHFILFLHFVCSCCNYFTSDFHLCWLPLRPANLIQFVHMWWKFNLLWNLNSINQMESTPNRNCMWFEKRFKSDFRDAFSCWLLRSYFPDCFFFLPLISIDLSVSGPMLTLPHQLLLVCHDQ